MAREEGGLIVGDMADLTLDHLWDALEDETVHREGLEEYRMGGWRDYSGRGPSPKTCNRCEKDGLWWHNFGTKASPEWKLIEGDGSVHKCVDAPGTIKPAYPCKYCGATGLWWLNTAADGFAPRWRMVDDDQAEHACAEYREAHRVEVGDEGDDYTPTLGEAPEELNVRSGSPLDFIGKAEKKY